MAEREKYELWAIETKKAPEETGTVKIAVYTPRGAMKVTEIEDALKIPTHLFPDGVPPEGIEITPMSSRKGRVKIPQDKLELICYFE